MAAIDPSKCINAVRALAAALPQFANAGHPGGAMGCAPMAHTLFTEIMRHDPSDPAWIGRDRFVLSNGHTCALLYTMLHLCGYDLSIDDLKQFRQMGSKCPGHPENHLTPGVEVTTGPLGQGLSQAVGLAAAATNFAARYNRADCAVFDNFVYTIVGDGCLQEGVASEAASLAGHWGLGRLIVLYDSNKITIDGSVELSFTENVAQRFQAYNWEVLEVAQGDTDHTGIRDAILKAKLSLDRPTLIVCHTTIGWGSNKEGSEKTHGAPLGVEDLAQMREKWGLPNALDAVPQDVELFYKQCVKRGKADHDAWIATFKGYKERHPEDAAEIEARFARDGTEERMKQLPSYPSNASPMSTRQLSQLCLNAVASAYPCVMGGSADLTPSNLTALRGEPDFQKKTPNGRYIRFGVREHAMAAICNGLCAFGGIRPFCATFLNFVGYAWGAVRLSALSQLGVLYIATHDSIELGEDGPTHQPIEMAPLCRATPNLVYFRPADGNEVTAAYATWLRNGKTPVVLALCRGATPHLANSTVEKALKGAYVAHDFVNDGGKKAIIGASGTEVGIAMAALPLLSKNGIDARIVSMPCWELFDAQSEQYRNDVLLTKDKQIPRLYVEAGCALGCEKYYDKAIQMTTFGASAPKPALHKHFGFTAENVANEVQGLLTLKC